MTSLPSWAELTGMLAALAAFIGAIWNRERLVTKLEGDIKSLSSDIEAVKDEAAKALRAHEAAMSMKNEELRLVRENTIRREDHLEAKILNRENRIQQLEDKLYMGGPK